MPEYKEKPNNGSLWTNTRKTNPSHPDFTGKIAFDIEMVKMLLRRHAEGKELLVEVSGWKKQTTGGKGFLSLSIKEPWEKPQAQAAPRAAPARNDFPMDDDIPF